MERFYNRVSPIVETSSSVNELINIQPQASSKQENVKVDLDNLPSDPGLRPHITSYSPDLIEQVRRAYLLKGPCQPYGHDFPQKIEGNRKRKFVASWFDEFKSWLEVSKLRLQTMRDGGWETLLSQVCEFCGKHDVVVLNMEDEYVARGRIRRRTEMMTNLHYYRVELFYSVIDMQAQELNQRFDEVNTDLLLCMACFDPIDSFSAFNKDKLLQLAKFYTSEFSEVALYELENQLESFILDVRLDKNFSEVSRIGGLAQKMVATRKHIVFPLVYLLIKLSLILPVATATVERAFSAMKIIKSSLRNRMGDQLLNDCLVTYIENDVFANVSNEDIMQQFQNMKNRREVL